MAAISAFRVTQHSQIFHFSLEIEFNALRFINYTIFVIFVAIVMAYNIFIFILFCSIAVVPYILGCTIKHLGTIPRLCSTYAVATSVPNSLMSERQKQLSLCRILSVGNRITCFRKYGEKVPSS